MNECLTTTGLMQRFHRLFGVLVFSLFSLQTTANAAPVVVNVDHRVMVTFSIPQLDVKQGVFATQVRIKNRSATSLFTPLRLSFDQAALGEVRILNAQGIGKDGLPYFEFALPKGVLMAGATTEQTKVVFTIEKNKGRYEGDKRDVKQSKKVSNKLASKDLRLPFASFYHVSAGVEAAPLEPRAEPYALKADSGKVNVRFSVRLAGKLTSSDAVYLRGGVDKNTVAMNDQGKDGDLIARDGIYGAKVIVDTSRLKADSCLSYEAVARIGKDEVVSSPLNLCVSAFPVRVAASNKNKPVVLSDGSKAIADEVLITVVPNTSSAVIQRLASDIKATVTGSIPPLNLYQLKLPAPVTSAQLRALVAQLKERPEVKTASVNAIGSYSYVPSDPEYVNQQGLQLIRAQDVWDAGATGSGVTVTVLDTGLDRTHLDFGTSPGNCQLAENDCGGVNNDTVGHGTQVAGVVAARTNNAIGVAGVSYGSKIHSIQVSPDAIITLAEMTSGFTNTATYGLASVINASFGGGPWASVDATALCSAINLAVVNSGIPVAVVIDAAGNDNSNGYFYPARCNVNDPVYHPGQHEMLTRKDLFITVANSASVVDLACGSVPVNQRCSDSNYGTWVDMAAPGSAIRTTAVGGGYASPSGTSFASPMVAGAAAILKSCGVPLDQIESTLRTSANVTVPFPDASSAPRLDIYRALKQVNHTPTAVLLSSSSINENTNTAGGVEIGTLTATDLDTCDKYTYTIVGGADVASFSIGGANNDRLRLSAGVLNYEAKSSYAVTVRVTDFFGMTFDQPLIVSVNNLNEAPSISNQVFSINENSPNGTLVGTVVASDPDAGDTLTYSITGANPGGFVINPATGALSVGNSAALNYETVPSHAFTLSVQVTDAGLLTAPVPATITVNLNNVNEAPVISNQVFAVAENSPNGTLLGTVLANDPDAGTTLTYSIIGANPGGFVINPATGALSVGNSAALDHETHPVYSLSVQVTDGALSSTATITVNVNNVNEAPTIANQTLPNINENSANGTTVGTVVASDPDVGDTLTYSITAGNTGNAFAINPATGMVTVNNMSALDYETTPTFNLTVRVTDAGLLFAAATVTINLNNLPESIPNPILVYDHKSSGVDGLGNTVDWYHFTVSNWNAYPAAMFVPRPDLPPCGLNTSASRTWVDFFRTSDNGRIYGFCALGSPADLNLIWIGMVPAGTAPPTLVYIKLTDRETGTVYTSNSVTVPFP